MVQLPDQKAWRLEKRGSWEHLVHAPSQSEVWLRHGLARRTVRAGECQAEAELTLPLLGRSGELIDDAPVSLSGGYAGQAQVILDDDGSGRVVAHLASVGRCLSFAFVSPTSADLALKLHLAAERILPSISRSRVEARAAPHEPATETLR